MTDTARLQPPPPKAATEKVTPPPAGRAGAIGVSVQADNVVMSIGVAGERVFAVMTIGEAGRHIEHVKECIAQAQGRGPGAASLAADAGRG